MHAVLPHYASRRSHGYGDDSGDNAPGASGAAQFKVARSGRVWKYDYFVNAEDDDDIIVVYDPKVGRVNQIARAGTDVHATYAPNTLESWDKLETAIARSHELTKLPRPSAVVAPAGTTPAAPGAPAPTVPTAPGTPGYMQPPAPAPGAYPMTYPGAPVPGMPGAPGAGQTPPWLIPAVAVGGVFALLMLMRGRRKAAPAKEAAAAPASTSFSTF
jgi:hypothetical protein